MKLGMLALLLGFAGNAGASGVLLEAETFANCGGWKTDTQFVDCMGSAYLIAHGMGIPVADAVHSLTLPHAGAWRVWVRTRDWTPDYEGEKPGRFRLAVNGQSLPSVLGVTPATWGWADAGTFTCANAEIELRLQDMTGFDGRCDAIYVTDDLTAAAPPAEGPELAAWRAQMLGEAQAPATTMDGFDLVVVGGGIAGTCAAIAAAEEDMRVALIQDRPMLGGNASDEIRVKTQGEERHRIVTAVKNWKSNGNPQQDADANRLAQVNLHTNIACFTGYRAYGVVTNGAGLIEAVDARAVSSGRRYRFRAPYVVDSTGDGWVAYWAGADYHMGREVKSEFGESYAPDTADASTMGCSMLWTSALGEEATAFPDVPWALPVSGTRSATSGDWTWETGLGVSENTIYDAEMLRDRLLRAVYGSFSNAKKKAENANRHLTWVPFNAGRRESRRIVGEYFVKQDDVVNSVYFDDAVASATWPIDLHYYNGNSGYIAGTHQYSIPKWYIPYRALICRDVRNLFLAGRCASLTHVAMGSSRVMNTCGQMGVAVGYAASLCKKYGCLPRDIYCVPERTRELQELIGGSWPEEAEEDDDIPEFSVVIDNEDTLHTQLSGTWIVSTSASPNNYCADNYYVNKSNGRSEHSENTWFAFLPSLPEKGLYEVALLWNSSAARATNAPVEIVTMDGVVTQRVDMTANGGAFRSLGRWSFDPNSVTPPMIRLLTVGASATQEGSAYVIADAVRVTRSYDTIVDNGNAVTSGVWQVSNSERDRYGDDYLHNKNVASENTWVRYTPDLPVAAVYRLEQMWNGNSSRASTVEEEVVYAEGTATCKVNMTQDSGRWNRLGVWRFAKGSDGSARILTKGTSGYVIADAFRWRQLPYAVLMDNADTEGVSSSGTWTRSQYSTHRYGVDYLHNGKQGASDLWFQFTPNFATNCLYDVYLTWNGEKDSGRSESVPVEVAHADGVQRISVNMGTEPEQWQEIGRWRFDRGSGGHVKILTEGTQGTTVIVDAILFVPVLRPDDAEDRDGNGLADQWERENFLVPRGVDPDGDPDGDNMTNREEYLTGTDPKNAASFFGIRSFQPRVTERERNFVLSWPSKTGARYSVLYTDNLNTPFTVYAQDIDATPPLNTVLLPLEGTTRFFQVWLQ